jgi:hypothetical protein
MNITNNISFVLVVFAEVGYIITNVPFGNFFFTLNTIYEVENNLAQIIPYEQFFF